MKSLVHIVGKKNHGKTTLIEELIAEFVRRGMRIGTIKHSSHRHELDAPGKDSHRHRQAGGSPAAVVTPETIGVFLPRAADKDFYGVLSPLYAACDLILVEGDIDGPGLKIEVWRRGLDTVPYAAEGRDIHAVVTDDPVEVRAPRWSRRDVAALADKILATVVARRPEKA
ncbi:MAG: molybdopterin-guanine dinucleotide biosynthesis protein B [Myxococcales bacterium]|nr:MAG: molybdopterin-guanine dinucleotide biosynthesis protein B [Myxococcales bacterium]